MKFKKCQGLTVQGDNNAEEKMEKIKVGSSINGAQRGVFFLKGIKHTFVRSWINGTRIHTIYLIWGTGHRTGRGILFLGLRLMIVSPWAMGPQCTIRIKRNTLPGNSIGIVR